MKKILLIVLLSSFSWGFGQTDYSVMSMSMLMILRTSKDKDVEDYLEAENWKYFSGEEETDNSEKVKGYIHNPSSDLKSGEENLFIFSSKRRNSNRVMLYVHSDKQLLGFIAELKQYGGKLIKQVKREDYFLEVFMKDDDIIEFIKIVEMDNRGKKRTSWYIDVVDKKDY
ncbi:hypothetical protein FNJ88_07415 [Chryseobacterium sp. SNU WT5]|uniref:hypothetical protein n=1 Tax=Chryseobacterium sp. SNU WT5 TaxID=2594269 RepID=UPI001180A3DC|nr:hypothetical protein [Chryseobacterium sp. SNU WT5]QDP85399.1 hypothetical protein FNJ88_07415 [Chryseobacterium sp. SNU WT5]